VDSSWRSLSGGAFVLAVTYACGAEVDGGSDEEPAVKGQSGEAGSWSGGHSPVSSGGNDSGGAAGNVGGSGDSYAGAPGGAEGEGGVSNAGGTLAGDGGEAGHDGGAAGDGEAASDDGGEGGAGGAAGLDTCGNGLVDAGEECDDADLNSPHGDCTPRCQWNVCGDGYLHSTGTFSVHPIEECEGQQACTDCELPESYDGGSPMAPGARYIGSDEGTLYYADSQRIWHQLSAARGALPPVEICEAAAVDTMLVAGSIYFTTAEGAFRVGVEAAEPERIGDWRATAIAEDGDILYFTSNETPNALFRSRVDGTETSTVATFGGGKLLPRLSAGGGTVTLIEDRGDSQALLRIDSATGAITTVAVHDEIPDFSGGLYLENDLTANQFVVHDISRQNEELLRLTGRALRITTDWEHYYISATVDTYSPSNVMIGITGFLGNYISVLWASERPITALSSGFYYDVYWLIEDEEGATFVQAWMHG
jgi:hypothetical protein